MKIKFYLIKLLFFLFLFTINPIKNNFASEKIYILTKVNNEIITNLDIKKELNYLIALNNNLKTVEKDVVYDLAKSSLVKEKIKKQEIEKYYDIKQESDYLNKVIIDLYKNLGLENEESFKNYLNNYNLELDEVITKLRIETIWNEFIFANFSDQLQIDRNRIKTRLELELEKNKITQTNYLLYEILFNVDTKSSIKEKEAIINKSISEVGFQSTAVVYSEAPSAKLGGKIGWINESQLSEKVINEINKLSVGEHTKPINIPGGLLILKIEDMENKEVELDLEKKIEEVVSYEKNKQLNQFSLIYYNKIKANAKIDEN